MKKATLQTMEYDGLEVEFYVQDGGMYIVKIDGQDFDARDEEHAAIAAELDAV